MAEKRDRLTLDDVQASLADLALLPIDEDRDTSRHAWSRTAGTHGIPLV